MLKMSSWNSRYMYFILRKLKIENVDKDNNKLGMSQKYDYVNDVDDVILLKNATNVMSRVNQQLPGGYIPASLM